MLLYAIILFMSFVKYSEGAEFINPIMNNYPFSKNHFNKSKMFGTMSTYLMKGNVSIYIFVQLKKRVYCDLGTFEMFIILCSIQY